MTVSVCKREGQTPLNYNRNVVISYSSEAAL